MHLDIISVLPELIASPLQHSIVQRAQDKNLVKITLHSLREYGIGNSKQVDDYPYGGGAGMVLMVEPILKLVKELQSQREYDEIIYLSPDGELLNQSIANQLSTQKNLILICGHYKGIDHRLREHIITREISIGDYVLSGGEIAAAVLADAIIRLVPGVLSDEESALTDSFQDQLLAPPVYTRPADFQGWKVPEILTSGNFPEIEKWRMEKAIENTRKNRPDLLDESQ